MKRLLILAFVALAVLPNLGTAQEDRRIQSDAISPIEECPIGFQQQAINLTASAPAMATPNAADFPTSGCSLGWETNFGVNPSNNPPPNKCFKHTFAWKMGSECRCMSGELTIHYTANQAGTGAGNDTVALYSGHSVVAGTSQALYSGVVTQGQTGTKMIRLTCDMLKNNRISFLVQDDTSVTSATLHAVYCCPSCSKGQVEETFPGTKLKYCCDGKPGSPRFCCTAKAKPGTENP